MSRDPWRGCYTASLHDLLGWRATGTVHSIFQHSFNVEIDGLLLNVGNRRDRLSPLGMVLDPETYGPLAETLMIGDQVKWNARKFAIYPTQGMPVTIPWDHLEKVQLAVPFGELDPARWTLVGAAIDRLNLEKRIGIPLDASMRSAVAVLRNPLAMETQRTRVYQWLLGRGKGLTPSGDDIVAGYAFAMWMGGEGVIDAALDSEARKRTTATSATLLHTLRFGNTAPALHQVWCAAQLGDSNAIDSALARMLAIGHTSGGDTVYGMGLGIDRLLASAPMNAPHQHI